MTEETLFAAALDRADPADRSAFLDAHCPDPDARRRVDELLAAHAAAGSFLDHPAAAAGADVTTALPPADPGVTRTQASTDPDATADPRAGAADPDEALAFLKPPTRHGSLGRLAHYEVLEVLGSGGFGTVLKAFDDRLHRVVAVKVLAPQLAASGAARTRFEREARSAAAVRDDHVVNVHAVSDPGDPLPYLVMELVVGQTLQAKLDKAGPLPPKEVLRIGSQIARGLAAAHKQGLIHRDIKPANILLENGVERVKVTDFGLARAADDASISQSGVVAGTPMYMSPEQARGDTLDTRSDLFSLGSVLYVMCTGRPPFRADSTLAVLKRVVEDEPRPVRDVNPEVPRWLADVVAKLHAKAPADRFQTAQEVAELLSGYLAELQQQGTVVSRVVAPPPKRKSVAARTRWELWLVVPLVLFVLLSGAAVLPEPADGMTRRESHVSLAFGFGFIGAVGLVVAALLSAVSRRWAVRLGAFTTAAVVAAAGNGMYVVLVPPGPDERGEVIVVPAIGLESVRLFHDGQPTLGWIDVSNGQTLRLPPGRYTLEPRFRPGLTVAAWEVTASQGRYGDGIAVGSRQISRNAEFELAPGGRVSVLVETKRIPPPVSWGDFVDPLGDCHVSEDAGGLTVIVPAGNHDLNPWPGGNLDAPRVLRDMSGDFEARVVVPKLPKPKAGTGGRPDGVSYVGAGLVVMQDDRPQFRLFRAGLATNNDGAPFAQCEWFPPGADRGHAAKYVPDGPLHLRLRRIGGTLHPAFSPDGQTWTELPAVTNLPLPARVRVGVATVSTYHQEVAFRFEHPTVEPADGFTPLFNGRDLTGWKTVPGAPANWTVAGGVLTGRGPVQNYLYSARGDYRDFHLRAECRVNDLGNSGVHFRATVPTAEVIGAPRGYEVQVAGPTADQNATGSLMIFPAHDYMLARVTTPPVPADTWFTLEVIARGRRVVVRVNEKVLVDHDHVGPEAGHLALQAFPGTTAEFRKIEIKELKASPPPAAAPFTAAEAKAHQEAWANHLGVKVEFENSVGMKMRLVPPGEFTYGTPNDEKARARGLLQAESAPQYMLDEVGAEPGPVRTRVPDPFYAGAHEVTVGQFRQFIAATKHQTDGERTGKGGWGTRDGTWQTHPSHQWQTPGWEPADDEPVVQVSWNDAQAFCKWLGGREGRTYALPTEVQWEYAARAGAAPWYGVGDDRAAADRVAWFNGNLPADRPLRPQPVGRKAPNPFGLYDTLGNVWEFCADIPANPGGRTMRGGSWYLWPVFARVNVRGACAVDQPQDAGTGFRVVVVGDLKAAAGGDGFVSLFNGKDLTGWKTHPDQPGEWRVDAGHLVSTRAAGYLFSEKGDWQDFHLRAEVHVSQGGNSGVFFRTPFRLDRIAGPDAGVFAPAGWYEADLFWGPVARPGRMKDLGETTETLAEPNQWMTLEVIARGNRFVTKVNGKVAVDVVDAKSTFARGHFALQAFTPGTAVRFRKIEVKELPPPLPPPGGGHALSFDGVDDYVEVPTLKYDGTHPITLEAWVRVPQVPDRVMHVVSNDGAVALGLNDRGQWSAGVRDQPGNTAKSHRYIWSAEPAAPDKLTHVALVLFGTEGRLFVDGKRQTTKAAQRGDHVPSAAPFFLGARGVPAGPWSYPLRGEIAAVRVSKVARYDRDFTPAAGRFDDDKLTTALYHFAEGKGDVLTDSSGNNHHGKIVGATWVPAAPPADAAVVQARRDLVAAKEKELAAVKARFDAGTVTRREVAEAEIGVFEAQLDGALPPDAVRLLGLIIDRHETRRAVVAARAEVGVLAVANQLPIDADIARAKARLAEVRVPVPQRAADVLPFWVGTWRTASEVVVPAQQPGQGRGGGDLVLTLVGDGKYLRGVGTEDGRPFQTLLVQTYDESKQALRGWFYMSDGKASGPGHGAWDADARTLLWTEKLPDGLQSVHRFEFIDADTVKSRLLHRNDKNEIVFELRNTFTRQKAPAAERTLPAPADRPAELAALDRLVGEWKNDTTVKALVPPAPERKVVTTERGRPILAGRFVEVRHTGGETGTNDYWLAGYDPAAKLYRTWFFGADGGTAEFAGVWDAAAATMRSATADGSASGSWVFPSADRRDGRFTIKDPAGQPVVELSSVSRRVVPGGKD